VNSTIDLGSSSKRWKDIYLSGNSIIIGSSIIGAVGAVINLPVGSTIAGAPIGTSNGVSTATFNSALANTNSYIDSKLTKTNPVIGGTLSVAGTTTLTNLVLSTVLSPIYGGTGLNSITAKGVLVGANSSSLGYITGSDGDILQLNGNSAPTFGKLDGGTY
jgi:hypothetical protein